MGRDSVESHQKLKTKYKLPFPLLSDAEGKICEKYDEVLQDLKALRTDATRVFLRTVRLPASFWRAILNPPDRIGDGLSVVFVAPARQSGYPVFS